MRKFEVSINAANHTSILGTGLDLFELEGGKPYEVKISGRIETANTSASAAYVTASVLQDALPGYVSDAPILTPPTPVLKIPGFPISSWDPVFGSTLEELDVSFQVTSAGRDRMLKVQFDSTSDFAGLFTRFFIEVSEVDS